MTEAHDANPDVELERLRERLAYYESFDQLIQKSVGDAGNILREAIEMRESAARESAEATHRAQSVQREQLESFRTLYSEMLDDVTALQGLAERLARRLSDAVDALEAELQPEVEFPSLPKSLTPELASHIDEPAEVISAIETGPPPPLPERAPIPETNGQAIESPSSQPEEPVHVASAEPGRFVLLVHGVPNAATALSLKSHLDTLPSVSLVEPREFAAGLLRLQLTSDRDLRRDDLTGWKAGRDVAVVLSRPGLLEVKLV